MTKEYLNDILLVFSSIGVINCFFTSIYLLFSARFRNSIPVKFLALLILMSVIRIGKSVVFYFYPGLSDVYINIGLAAFTAVGPFFYLLVRSVIDDIKQLRFRDYWHFIPLLLVLVNAGAFPHRHNPVWLAVYRLVLLQMLVYFLISFEKIKKSSKELMTDIESLFIPDIFKGLLFIWLSYFIHSIVHGYPYVLSPLIFTFVFYFLFYKIFIRNKISGADNFVKYKNINLDQSMQQQYAERVLKIMRDEDIYLKNQLTLSELAKMVQVSPQILSYVINNHFSQNFPDFVNSYRIQSAQRMLNSPEFKNFTISSIAYECGFNSISVFNNAFKKFTGMTPSGFRNNSINS